MSARSLLSKISLFILLISCKNVERNATEIICQSQRILVENARPKDVYQGIRNFLMDEKRLKISEKYTVITLPNRSTVYIRRISPEELIKCNLREVPSGDLRGFILI